jgi:hypothetical protein
MGQGKPSSLSSNLRNGGRDLLYKHPVTGSRTFKPSGNPETDSPEIARESSDEHVQRAFRLDTPEGRDAWDAHFGPEYINKIKTENAHWERIRFQMNKSPRARKRALEREARRDQKAPA